MSPEALGAIQNGAVHLERDATTGRALMLVELTHSSASEVREQYGVAINLYSIERRGVLLTGRVADTPRPRRDAHGLFRPVAIVRVIRELAALVGINRVVLPDDAGAVMVRRAPAGVAHVDSYLLFLC
jgi:hypothetical protein